jgi:hypothetical protein
MSVEAYDDVFEMEIYRKDRQDYAKDTKNILFKCQQKFIFGISHSIF